MTTLKRKLISCLKECAKTDMVNKIKELILKLYNGGFAHLVGSSILNKIFTFMSSVILVRLISKTDYGIYSNANNLLGFFTLISGFGMSSTLLQFGCTQTGKDKENTWNFGFHFAMVFDIFLSISIIVVAIFVPISIEGTGSLLLLMSFLPFARLISELQRVYLRTELQNKEYAKANNFSTIITVVLAVILSYFFTVKGLIIANYLAAIATIIFIAVKYSVPIPPRKNDLTKGEKIKLLKFSAVCTINNSTSSVMYLLDTFVLGIVVAESTVTASYKVATTIPNALAFIPSCIMIYIYPYFAKKSNDGKWLKRNYKRVLLYFGIFNLATVGTIVIFAPLVIKIVFGSQYLDAVAAFRMLCISYIVQSTFRTIPGQLLVTQGKLKYNTFVGFASGILNTILNVILISAWGMNGAAAATLIVTIIFAISSTIYLAYVFKKKE